MPDKTINGVTVSTDDDGFLQDHSPWNKDMAATIAEEEGITLTDAHWKVLDYILADFAEKGAVPGMRRLNKVGGIPTKELYSLFPGGPIKKAAKIAGLPKPASCV
ncbi:TusE/DsrC/DsvC family sulfur relay protein [Sulfuriroseicoccus oceanibius]|uniref:TusE/DsrC/DsvC family sulfur relay protein n=1 Tax=Sulfuriroseicoccus oceanibius TaxID=2707525 RepID=A0A6B3L728_9BACT|nr:TusE/DsrC/DsvC family sulfur relay protein [Sulfuriroseicoccus oceanibius]QQL45640.1 TusE/DsrC/DsvC family sulfur relay protein [Sulfuriroseicoccus oceanibius]